MKDVSFSDLKVKRLTEDDRINSFCSGDTDMDDYIVNKSHLFSKHRLSSNYVLISEELDDKPVAFFTLSCDRVCMSDFTTSTDFNRFRRKRFSNSKRLKGFPAVKIGRIAVISELQGQGLGPLLIEALKCFISSIRFIGCRFITVDAYISRIGLYRKCGFDLFSSTEINDKSRTAQMYYDLLTITD